MLLSSCKSDSPVITSIDPKIGRAGENITLTGKNFGKTREDSFITIAGITPTGPSYQVWQDDLIVVRVPEPGESGLVYVHVEGKRSNGVLFTNLSVVPRAIDGEESGLLPRIAMISPHTGMPGSLVTITGSNFGSSRPNIGGPGLGADSLLAGGGVFFSWDYEASSFSAFSAREPEFIEVSELELGYEFWSAREIRVRVPDGAVSGNMEIRTPHGTSRPVLFEISGKPGFKNFRDRRGYSVNYSVDIRVLEATRPNNLYLMIPKPVTSSSQRNVTLISRNATPFVENHRGVSIYKLDNITAGSTHRINISYNVEVYAVETGMRPLSVRQDRTPLHTAYTQSTNLIPADNPQIRSTVNTILGREQNPFNRARLLYDWIINQIEITENMDSSVTVVSALEQKKADSYSAALLYAAMARAAGIPAIPVAGILVNRTRQTHRHYWAEIWINGFGWVPVDPVMGTRAVPDSFITIDDTANFYFGNLDNHRIAFSRGELNFSQMESRGRIVYHPRSYSLQNIWEEASGGLESYSSLWGDIIITGIFVH